MGDFDGTAAKVKTTDTYGLVVSALGESTAQALIDAIANKVMNELINKNKIVNNLLATDASTVLAGTQGAALDKRLVAAENAVTKLNSELSEKAKITNISSLSSIGDIFKTYSKNGSIPVIGIINWDTTLAPDQNVTIAFVWNYLIVAISSSGCIYTASPNAATWQKRN